MMIKILNHNNETFVFISKLRVSRILTFKIYCQQKLAFLMDFIKEFHQIVYDNENDLQIN
jgi:hypothetical protein